MCAQSVPGLGFGIDPLKLCVAQAPAHTKQLADNCYTSVGHAMSFKGLGALITTCPSDIPTGVPGLGFEIDPLELCAAPVHTINLKTASKQHGSGTLGMQCLSKALVLLSQPVQVIYREVCAQSVPGLGFEVDPLKLCAAPVHTKQLADNTGVVHWTCNVFQRPWCSYHNLFE